MIPANVKLSKSELSLACDASFILTKNAVIEKACQLFGIVAPALQQQAAKTKLPQEILMFSPKIYRGEKYRELPYVMLDYPRCFLKENVFAVRCHFWWGNHFSITLHLAGKYADEYSSLIIDNLFGLNEPLWYVCFNESQWEHHFESDNFISIHQTNATTVKAFVWQYKFLKIAKRLPLSEWDYVIHFFNESNKEILQFIEM
jgi:hypothetical protein